MADVYTDLAKKMDELPQGFPATESGLELKILRKIFTPEEGLVHCTYNVQMGQTFVCNCCPCCCGILRGAKDYNAPYMLASSNFVALIDPDDCTQCGVCADERCPMDAIVEEGGEYGVLSERCIGCGVCIPTCPTEAIQLVRRPESDQDTPPADLIDWSVQRAGTRGLKLELE